MNAASLKMCKELYELSGWFTEIWFWHQFSDGTSSLGGRMLETEDHEEEDVFPAYDLGYLLRKLPKKRIKLRNVASGWYCQFTIDTKHARMVESQRSGVQINRKFEYNGFGATPEDATAKLAIELLKEGELVGEAS